MPNGHHRRHCDNCVSILLVYGIASSIAAMVSASHQHCHCRCSLAVSSISALSLSWWYPLRPCLCHSATAISSAAASAPSIDVVLGRFSPAASTIAFVFLIAPSCQHCVMHRLCPGDCSIHSTIVSALSSPLSLP